MQKTTSYKLLTFYKFADLPDPEQEVRLQKQLCQDIGMKGRIFIGEEGINATVTGNKGQLFAYMLYLRHHPFFHDIPDIDEKAVEVDGHKFPKMIVRYRKEIVALGESYSAAEIERAANKMSPEEFKEIMDDGEAAEKHVILDMRNNYEYELGHFKGAIPAGTVNFRDFKESLQHYKEKYGDKQIIMYCTGGIRCEKIAVTLERAGLKGVRQLDGGVVKYVNKYPDGNWLGNLYTFDDRVSADVAEGGRKSVISKCRYTGEPADSYFNCRYGPCNAQFTAKPKEYRMHMGFCCSGCAAKAGEDLLVRDISWDPMQYKHKRGQIKRDPAQKEEIAAEIRAHMKKWLHNIAFNHEEPARKEIILA